MIFVDGNGNTGELLVGAGTWTGEQLSIVAIGSINLSDSSSINGL